MDSLSRKPRTNVKVIVYRFLPTNLRPKAKKTLGGFVILATIILFAAQLGVFNKAQAVTRTWDNGAGDGLWSSCANWSGDLCPGASDVATFASSSNTPSTIDALFGGSVGGVNITAGYTATITQARSLAIAGNWTQADGTFAGGSQAITLDTSFNLSGGTFTSTSGNLTFATNMSITGTPTFNANGGTVTVNTSLNSTLSCGSVTFNLFVISKTSNGPLSVASNCTLPLGNSPTSEAGITNNGTINVGTGTWNHSGSITNNATISTTLTTFDQNGSGATSTFTSNTGGSFTMSGTTWNTEGSFTYTAGTLPSNLNITFNGPFTSNVTCGAATFSSFTISKTVGAAVNIGSDCSISLGNSPSSSGSITNNGTITVGTGTWAIDGNLINNSTISTTLTTLDLNGGGSNQGSFTSNVGGTLTMTGATFQIERNFTYSGGTIPSNIAMTLNGSLDQTTTCGAATFSSFAISKSSTASAVTISSGCNIDLGNGPTSTGSITNNGTINVGTGTWTINGNLINNTTVTTSISTFDFNAGGGNQGSFTSNSGGSLTAASNPAFTVERNFTYNAGTVPSGIVLTMDGNSLTGNLTCGSLTIGSLIVVKPSATFTPASSCTLTGDFTRTSGTVSNPASAYIYTVPGNISMSATDTFGGANLTFEMTGSANKTITQNAGTFSSKLKINKTVGNSVTQATNLTLGGTLDVTSGTFDQGATFNLTTGGTTTIGSNGTWSNSGTGDLALAGGVSNSGTISFDGSGGSCGNTDTIAITSTASPTQFTWSGSGTFAIYDVTAQDQAGSITAYNSTNISNNSWTFVTACPTFSQSDYRWYANADSTTPGSSLAAENSTGTTATSTPIRLRMNVQAATSAMSGSSSQFKLQMATSTSGPWSDVNANWWNSSWLNRKVISFDNTASSSNLTDFPVLIALDSTKIDYSKTQNSGQDIRFVDGDGTALSYEIEKWDESGTSLVWVKVPK
jgi:hypothetical protein